MKDLKTVILAIIVLIGATGNTFGGIINDKKALELPAGCERLQVDDGSKVAFRVYAIGVQVYRWNGAAWDFVGPIANLYADADFNGLVGTHYGGPTWEDNGGSKVIGRRLEGCTPNSTSISWLLLEALSSQGPGIFHRISFIQRVNTQGGVVPSVPGSGPGEEARVPYTTEYIFYRPAK